MEKIAEEKTAARARPGPLASGRSSRPGGFRLGVPVGETRLAGPYPRRRQGRIRAAGPFGLLLTAFMLRPGAQRPGALAGGYSCQ